MHLKYANYKIIYQIKKKKIHAIKNFCSNSLLLFGVFRRYFYNVSVLVREEDLNLYRDLDSAPQDFDLALKRLNSKPWSL